MINNPNIPLSEDGDIIDSEPFAQQKSEADVKSTVPMNNTMALLWTASSRTYVTRPFPLALPPHPL